LSINNPSVLAALRRLGGILISNRRRPLITVILAASASTAAPGIALADDAPAPPPPQDTWFGKGQAGFLESKGNSNAESINGNVDLSRFDGPWKNEITLVALYGKNNGIVSAERYEAREQTNYNFTPKMFAFGGLRYEHDLFDGFQYQASATGGLGYKFLDGKDTTLSAQIGAGFRQIRPEILLTAPSGEVTARYPQDTTRSGIGTFEVDFMHKFSESTTLTDKYYMEAGAGNTMLQNNLQLAVKMTTKLALAIGYQVIDNTNPAPGSVPALKKVDQLTTVNLQYSF
jgi:putative salt-induced outer membrane protein